MEHWSKPNSACSLSFVIGERSYYGTHLFVVLVNGNAVMRDKLPEIPTTLIRSWLMLDGFSVEEVDKCPP